MPKPIKATGNCFDNCGRFLLNDQHSEMTLVHCNVVGTGSSVKGIKYSHAFLITGDGNFAMDLTNDQSNPIMVPLQFFRQLGAVTNELHYSRGEAVAEMIRTEHFGPWDDSLATDADKESIQPRGKKGKRWS